MDRGRRSWSTEWGKRFGRTTILTGWTWPWSGERSPPDRGENGAGKSTLMRICAGLGLQDSGTVTATGRIGYRLQIPGLFELLSPPRDPPGHVRTGCRHR